MNAVSIPIYYKLKLNDVRDIANIIKKNLSNNLKVKI